VKELLEALKWEASMKEVDATYMKEFLLVLYI
jgi:hypothetical protein